MLHSACVYLISTLVLFSLLNSSSAAESAARTLFADTSAFEFVLEGPFGVLTRNRSDEPELPGLLKYREQDGREIELKVMIKSRGNSRLRNCSFPPLGLNFAGAPVAGTFFAGQEKLKLVTHCKSTVSNRNYVAREYQIYHAYNLVTDYSFRVRWVSINYVDTDSHGRSFQEPGFLIEADREAADRLGLEILDVESQDVEELDRQETALMSLFQFMIGNGDWSALKGPPGEMCCHNFKLLARPGLAAGRIIIPYDFDQSGFVAADYAVHNESLGLRPNQRMFKGYCDMNGDIDAATRRLVTMRQQWLDMLDGEPVSRYARRKGVRYIEHSYKIITDPRRVEREITGKCRK